MIRSTTLSFIYCLFTLYKLYPDLSVFFLYIFAIESKLLDLKLDSKLLDLKLNKKKFDIAFQYKSVMLCLTSAFQFCKNSITKRSNLVINSFNKNNNTHKNASNLSPAPTRHPLSFIIITLLL